MFQIRDRRRSVLLTATAASSTDTDTDTDTDTNTMAHTQLRESSSSSSYMAVSSKLECQTFSYYFVTKCLVTRPEC
jgi:uncharacterized membrane-anchored protein